MSQLYPDIMKFSLRTLSFAALFAAAVSSSVASAGVPEGYYDSLEGLCGVELKAAVKALAADHTVISYGDPDPDNYFHPVYVSTWTVFQTSDTRTVDDVLCWWDMYSANNIWVSDGHPGLNIEHSVANSWWGGKSGSTEAYNDLHHLNPSNGDANGQKSNWPLGMIQGNPYWTNGVTTTGTPSQGLGNGASRVFQPYPSYRGDFARAYLYIFTIYDDIPWKDDYNWMYNTASALTLKPWAYQLLLQWGTDDPVSVKEISRNDAIFAEQKNRNPFIDCPQLADHIWGDKKTEPFHYSLYTPPAADPEQYPGWDEEFPALMTGHWEPVSSIEDINRDEEYFIISPTKGRAMTYSLISTGKAIDECTYSPRFNPETGAVTAVPQNIATVKFEPADDGNWYLAVYDHDGRFCGYINVKTSNNAIFSQTKVATCKASVSVDAPAGKTVVTYDVNGSPYTLQYNSGNPRFAAYASNQNPIQLYRATDEVSGIGVGPTGLDSNAEEVIIGIFDINGRKVAATDTSSLSPGIYIVVTNFGSKKIRK